MITRNYTAVVVGSDGLIARNWEDELMVKSKDKTIVIVVYRGLVSEVKNIPPGWDYIIDDKDILEEEPGIPPHSTIEPGKFEASGDIGKKLYEITTESGQDDQLGDVEDFGWYALIIDTGISGVPHAIVNEDHDGFFDYTSFDTEKAAREAWDKLEHEYGDFMVASGQMED